MNQVLQLFPPRNVGEQTYAIMSTPCYPASFYFGPVNFQREGRMGEWMSANNATSNWHRTHELARIQARKMFGDRVY